MADKDHLSFLFKGADGWNHWRASNPDIVPDLSGEGFHYMNLSGFDLSRAMLAESEFEGSKLSGASMRGAFLHRADFTNVNMSDADLSDCMASEAGFYDAILEDVNLSRSDLTDTNFNHAHLEQAILREANLYWASFESTYLEEADLSGAILRGTIFAGARFSRTRFDGARMGLTIFSDVDLREAVALETVEHYSRSTVGLDTIYRSEGNIPELFLRGCGVPEPLIVQIPALVTAAQPVQFYSCFISYSSKDEELAKRLHSDLQARGVRCWFAPEDLKIGERFRRRIDEVIRVHDKLLLILSEHSIASSWVEKEVETAMEREDEQHRAILFPVRLDNAVMQIKAGWPADVRRTRHIGDFRRWKDHDEYQKAFARLLADLKASA